MIILVNGAFGIGKTSVARMLVSRLSRAVLYDPELVGMALQRAARLAGHDVADFQNLRVWRRLTIVALRLARLRDRTVVVPMAFSNAAYLNEIRAAIARFEPNVVHVCLVAPVAVVHERLRSRGADPERQAWEYRRAEECCAVHGAEAFAVHVDADRELDPIVREIMAVLGSAES